MSHHKAGARSLFALLFIAALLFPVDKLAAHPHAWIDMQVDFRFDETSQLEALQIVWEFDEFYTAFAVEEFQKQKDGTYAASDLAKLTEANLGNLESWNYFTEIERAGEKLALGKPYDGLSTYNPKTGRLKLVFMLPLAKSTKPTPQAPINLRIYDPSYYISIEYVKENPVTISGGAHQGCSSTNQIPEGEKVWGGLPESAFNGPAAATLGKNFAATTILQCT